MLVVNDGKTTVSSWGLTLKPGERKKIYGIVSRKAIKCSSLSFYPDDPDEVGMVRYNYPGRKVIMSSLYGLENKLIVTKKNKPIIKLLVIPNKLDDLKNDLEIKTNQVNNELSELNNNLEKIAKLLLEDIKDHKIDESMILLSVDLPVSESSKEITPSQTAVLPELPQPVIPPQPKKRRGRRPKITQLVTDADLEKARIEALKLDLKLEAEESELQKTEN